MDARPKLNSLMYHDIRALGAPSRYCFTIAEFRRHLRAIQERVGGAPAVVGAEGDAAGFALTFDDGYPGWLAAAEELLRLRWRAHFFVITDVLGKSGCLARSDIPRLASMGHVIGSHSVDHPAHFASLGDDALLRQWRDSKAALEDILGRAVNAASVPGGGYSERVARAAEASGFSHLFTSEPIATGWRVGRCRVQGRFTLVKSMSSRKVARLAAGAPSEKAREYLVWHLKKAVKAALLPRPRQSRH